MAMFRTKTNAWERLGQNVIKWVGIIFSIRSVMELLPTVIGALDGVDVKPGQLLEALAGATLLIVGVAGAVAVLSKLKINAGAGLQGVAIVALAIPMIVASIYATIMAIGGLSEALNKIGSVDAAMSGLKKFFTGLGETFGALSGAFQGAKAGAMSEAAADGMANASKTAANIDVESLQKLKDAMAIIKVVSDNMPKNPSLWQQWFGGGITFGQFPEAMKDLSQGALTFANTALAMGKDKIEAADNLAEFFRKLLVVANLTQMLQTFPTTGWDLGFLDFLETISNPGKYGYDELDSAVESMSSFATEFNAIIAEAALEIDVTPLVDAICNGIQSDESRIKLRTALTSIGAAFGDEGMQLPGVTVEGDSSGGLNFISQLSSLFSGGGLTSLMGGLGGEGGLAGMLNGALEGFNAEDVTNKLGLSSIINFDDMTTEMTTMVTSMQTALEQSGESLSVPAEMAWSDGNVPTWWSGGADMPVTGTVTIDASSLTTITSGLVNIQVAIANQGNAVVSAVSALGTQIDALGTGISNIGTSISNLRLVLDTGAIAGAVDARLGEKAALLTRQ
jgi:hypothetical protein